VIPLNQPVINTAGGFFKERVNISLKHVIKEVALRYTLNGTEPDSASSIYREAFWVDSSFKLTVKAFKKGWLPSKSVSSQFFKSGLPIAKAILQTSPDPKYALNADKILIDLDAGDPGDFGTRALGYQKNDAVVILDMGKPTVMHSLNILNLQNLGAYIFPPVQMQVWGSNSLENWKLLSSQQTLMPVKLSPANTPFLALHFPATSYRYLKFSAKPIAKLPEWHPGKGQPGWFFMSELVVN
jgi:Chitobiase/beta-hexosaminidase C-terminal domain